MVHVRTFVVAAAVFGLSSHALAADWAESVNGDISGDRLNPTLLALSIGSNVVTGTFGPGDIDYLRIDVPSGQSLSALRVNSYVGPGVSFIGVQPGTTFTVPANAAQPSNLLGYTLFGASQVGTNILPSIGTGSGSTGFTPPLGAGSYTLWMQETGVLSSYSLDFVIVPAPASAGLLLCAAGLLRRRR